MPNINASKKAETSDETEQVLLIRYEDLKYDLPKQVLRIAKYLELEGILSSGESSHNEILDRVLERVSFAWMREHQNLFHPISVRWKPGYNFIRKGSVGDHDTIFDDNHKAIFVQSVLSDFGGKEKAPSWLQECCYHY